MILCFIYEKLTIFTFFVIVSISSFPIPQWLRKIKEERGCYALWYRICIATAAQLRQQM